MEHEEEMKGRLVGRMESRYVREREVEMYLIRCAQSVGGRCEKFSPDHRAGWPDRILILPQGRLVWVELKKPKGGRLSDLQLHAHKILRDLGQRVAVVWTKDQAEELIADTLAAPGTRA